MTMSTQPKLLRTVPLQDKVMARCTPVASGCWEWDLYTDDVGYGRTEISKGNSTLAHRVSYEAFVEFPPKELKVLHKCDNPSCVNPEHLFLGTQADNVEDRQRKGRSKDGEWSKRRRGLL
jgi:hypothetical protein